MGYVASPVVLRKRRRLTGRVGLRHAVWR